MKARISRVAVRVFLLGVLLGVVGCDIQPNPELVKAANEQEQGSRVRQVQMPEILAEVDGAQITRVAFQNAIKQTVEYYRSQGMRVPVSQVELLEMVLNQLIAKELVYQEAKKRGVDVEAGVEETIAAAREKAGSPERFLEIIQQRGLTEEQLREATRRQLMTQTIIDEELTSKVEITAEQVDAFYSENQQRFLVPERVHARHILISVPQGSPETVKEEALAKAQQILSELESGADFAEVAKRESEDQASAANGGDLGFFTRQQMPPAFASEAFAMEPGKLSGVVETSFGYHLIYVEERLPEEQVALDEDLRGTIEQQLLQDGVKDMLRVWAKELETQHEVRRFFNLSETLEQVRQELEAEALKAGGAPAKAAGEVGAGGQVSEPVTDDGSGS